MIPQNEGKQREDEPERMGKLAVGYEAISISVDVPEAPKKLLGSTIS